MKSQSPKELQSAEQKMSNLNLVRAEIKDNQTGANIQPDYYEIPHTGMRKIISERLTAASRDIPHFNLSTNVTVSYTHLTLPTKRIV